MVLLSSLEEWQKQSSLLLQARPSTTRIVTKYNIPNLASSKYNKPSSKSKDDTEKKEEDRTPRATLELRTFDTASGVVLKFQTDRAADVGRLIAGLGTLGRHMAALPEKAEAKDVPMADQDVAEPAVTAKPQAPSSQQQTQSSAGGKKKKKGKK